MIQCIETSIAYDMRFYQLRIYKTLLLDNEVYVISYVVSRFDFDDSLVDVDIGCFNVSKDETCFVMIPHPHLLTTLQTNKLESMMESRHDISKDVPKELHCYFYKNVMNVFCDIYAFCYGI